MFEDIIINLFQIIEEFYKDYKEVVLLLLTTAFSGFGLGGLSWLRERRKKHRRSFILNESLPFKVVRPNQDVFPVIFGRKESEYAEPFLVDWQLFYQDREIGINHISNIISLLNQNHWVIITGSTGIGKTRELAEVAHRFSRRGWTVMVFTGKLEGDCFPGEQFNDVRRNVLFIFDDLHIHMRRSESVRDNRSAEAQTLPGERPLQERLLAALEHCDRYLIPDTSIKVLATARDETVIDNPRDISPWEMLYWEKYPLWARFTRYELPKPENKAIVCFLENNLPQINIKLECDLDEIARCNDRTFRNLVVNLEILLDSSTNDGQPLSLNRETFKPTLRGSWEQCYRDAIKLYPLGKYLYDAVDLLQQANIPLNAFIAKQVALLLVGGNWWQKWWYRWQFSIVLEKLEVREEILSPRDGQIEGKGNLLNLEDYRNCLGEVVI